MLINRDTNIIGQRVILVPYKKEHVIKYHEWMKSPELQLLTASEPLSIEEEYAMQNSWQVDENSVRILSLDKSELTFIILDKNKYEDSQNEIESMIGDTNLFFANSDDKLCAEAEIMIAEAWARGRKCGWEAMLLMLCYGVTQLNVKQYIVKVSYINTISIKMFINMGFTEISRSDIFQEITMSKIVDNLWMKWLMSTLGKFEIKDLAENKEYLN